MSGSPNDATRVSQAPAVRAGATRWAAPAPFLITGLIFASYFVRIP